MYTYTCIHHTYTCITHTTYTCITHTIYMYYKHHVVYIFILIALNVISTPYVHKLDSREFIGSTHRNKKQHSKLVYSYMH